MRYIVNERNILDFYPHVKEIEQLRKDAELCVNRVSALGNLFSGR
jgi:hypothetical protein